MRQDQKPDLTPKWNRTITFKEWYLRFGMLGLLAVSCLLMVLGVSVGGGLGTAGFITGILLFSVSIALIPPDKDKE